MEVWKDIDWIAGLYPYEVSSFGQVRSKPKTVRYSDGRVYNYTSSLLCPKANKRGYLHVNLFYAKGKSKTVDVHVLVAKAFLPNPENKREVNHLDCNKSNNHYLNLEWSTSRQNKQHAIAHGLYDKLFRRSRA